MMKIKDIIDKLGGYMVVAKFYKIDPSGVSNWKRFGIPMRYWEDISKRSGISIEDIFYAVKEVKRYDTK